jgi:hypothetical protein
MGLRPFGYWDCGFESREYESPSLVRVLVCCKAVVSATGRSLVQSILLYGLRLSAILAPQRLSGLGPRGLSSHEEEYVIRHNH